MPEDQNLRHGIVVLAAGTSRRLGQAKALIEMNGETLVHRAVRLALDTGPSDCVVVCAEGDRQVSAAVADLACRVIPCADASRGMSASLHHGLHSLAKECAAALIVLTDQPGLTSHHLCALRDAWHALPTHAAASGYADTIGVPALLPRTWFEAMVDVDSDHGARELLRARRNEVCVVAAHNLAIDIDTHADLVRIDVETANTKTQ